MLWGGGGGPDDRSLLYSPSELLVLGSGHRPDPQILTQDQAVICSLSGRSLWPGSGCKLEAQWTEPGPRVGFTWPMWNFFNEWSQRLNICSYYITTCVSGSP